MASHLLETTASYYDSTSKKWNAGTFTLTNSDIQFHFDNSENIIVIPLNTVSGLEKKQSSFIFAAIVISVLSEKHWFASFINRDSVYNLSELFWREALLSKQHIKTSLQPNAGSSDLGKDLLNLLHESEATLVNAANSLSDQGRQIEETQATVEDINTDLNVAEKFIRNMSLTRTLFQLASSSKLLEQQKNPEKCFKISFSEVLNDNCFWKAGLLFVGENMTILSEDEVMQFSLQYDEINSFKVMSSWKICLEYKVRNTKKSCYIACPKLEKLLRLLSSITAINEKIIYAEDIKCNTVHRPSIGEQKASCSSFSKLIRPQNLLSENDQLKELETISDEDIQEISTMLNNLQDLASQVSKEQMSQMEKIDSLVSNVERTELRIKADSKTIKKLI